MSQQAIKLLIANRCSITHETLSNKGFDKAWRVVSKSIVYLMIGDDVCSQLKAHHQTKKTCIFTNDDVSSLGDVIYITMRYLLDVNQARAMLVAKAA